MEQKITLYYNLARGKQHNSIYLIKKEVYTIEDLKTVVSYDHVCAEYRDNHRSNSNFIQANCSMFDIDNTESDNCNEWVTPQDIQKAFPNVPFYVSYSRNHMKQKGDKSPRPKFHVYFPDIPPKVKRYIGITYVTVQKRSYAVKKLLERTTLKI